MSCEQTNFMHVLWAGAWHGDPPWLHTQYLTEAKVVPAYLIEDFAYQLSMETN